MTAPRFYIDPQAVALRADAELVLPAPVARHASQVLRLRIGAPIVLFDGTGGEYPATLVGAGRDARAHTQAHVAVEREPSAPVTLVQSLVAADVMDGIVRKAVELGVAAIQPVLAERSQRGPAERLDRRLARWRQIAVAACEQCGRNRIPVVAAVLALSDWIAASPDLAFAALLDPRARTSLAAAGVDVRALIVGPEGGLTGEEGALALARGARAVHLGSRILRADTAALAGLATINCVAGDAR